MVLARCSALFTDAGVTASMSAVWAAEKPMTSRRSSTARQVLHRRDERQLDVLAAYDGRRGIGQRIGIAVGRIRRARWSSASRPALVAIQYGQARTVDTAVVTLTTTFEPLDPTGADELSNMIHGAFQGSLESLRRYLEDKLPWDAA